MASEHVATLCQAGYDRCHVPARHSFRGAHMGRTLLTLILAMVPVAAEAQRDSTLDRQSLPRDVQREVVSRWNAPAALRSSGRLEVEDSREVRGDVAVLRGPLIIAGHVTGDVVAVNSDVILRPTAQIDVDVL